MSDETRIKLSKTIKMIMFIDSKKMGEIDPGTYFTETREIEVPKGVGLHTIEYVMKE
ncbi:hypothetical protein KEJ27_09275 [Candidatus Bathyarchaeota archaeon]|nr:hypothetical protein [Candidatus Bathyarchaeota archaeon]